MMVRQPIKPFGDIVNTDTPFSPPTDYPPSLPSMADAAPDLSDGLDATSSHSSLQSLSLPDTASDDRVRPAQPPPLHLTPCTWADIDSFDEVADQRYEVVDGIFVAMPVERVRHNRAVCLLLKLMELLLMVDGHWAPSHQVRYRLDKDDKPNYRIPDGACTLRDPCSPGSSASPANTPPRPSSSPRQTSSSSDSSSNTARARVQQIASRTINFLLENPAHIVVEFTSEGTRTNDMTYKWVEYAVAGIPFYVIIDAHDVSPDGIPRVIIGFKQMAVHRNSATDEPAERHARTGFPPSENVDTEWFDHVALSEKDELYHKIVIKGDDPVSFGLLANLDMKASNFASPTYLEGRIKKEMKAQGRSFREYEKLLKQVNELAEQMGKLQHKLAEEKDEKGRLKQTLAEEKRALAEEKRENGRLNDRVSELENEIFKLRNQTPVRRDRAESSWLGPGPEIGAEASASSSQIRSSSRQRPNAQENDASHWTSHWRSKSRSGRRMDSQSPLSRQRARSLSRSGENESDDRRDSRSPSSRRRSRSRSRSGEQSSGRRRGQSKEKRGKRGREEEEGGTERANRTEESEGSGGGVFGIFRRPAQQCNSRPRKRDHR